MASQNDILPFLLMGQKMNQSQMPPSGPVDDFSAYLQQQNQEQMTPPVTQQDMTAAAAGMPSSMANQADPAASFQQQGMAGQQGAGDQVGGMEYMQNLSPLAQQLLSAYQSSIGSQQEQLSQAEQRLSQAQQQREAINLMPLAQLVDTWTGSKFAQSYVPPQSKENIVQKLQEAVLSGRGNITKTQMEMLGKALDIERKQEEKERSREDARIKRDTLELEKDRLLEDKEEKKLIEARKSYNKEFGKDISGLSAVMNAAERVRAIIAEGNSIPTSKSDPRRQEYLSAVADLTTGFNRDVAKLGALAGADLELLNAATANSTSLMDAYFRNLFGKGSIQGTLNVLDNMMRNADRNMNEFEQRVKDTYLGRADEAFKNQRAYYQKAREQGRLRQSVEYAPLEGVDSTSSTDGKTREQLIEEARQKSLNSGGNQ